MTWLNNETKTYGLFIGVYLVGLGILFKVTGLDRSGSAILWMFYIAGPVFAYFLTRAVSAVQPLGYWRAFAMASISSLIGASIYAIFVYGYNGFIDDGFLTYVRDQNLPAATRGLTDPTEIEAKIKQLDEALSPANFAFVIWIRLQLVYAVLTAGLLLFLRKKIGEKSGA